MILHSEFHCPNRHNFIHKPINNAASIHPTDCTQKKGRCAVFPAMVKADKMGYLQTAYGNYDPMFIEAFRTLNNKIKTLEQKEKTIDSQEKRIAELEAQVKLMLEKK